jgi:hypothetical protein
MTRGEETYTTKIEVGLDARAQYNLADRKQQFDAAMRVYNLLGEMTFQVDRINSVKDALGQRAAKLGSDDALRKQLASLSDKADEIRKKIVATKEGGDVTGEERIREKAGQLYGDLLFYEGRPGDYQVARIDSLKHELDDVVKEFDTFVEKDLRDANLSLAKKKMEAIHPLARADWDKANPGT